MALPFLCARHKQHVLCQPEQAIIDIQNAQLSGEALFKRYQFAQALPYLGCALESASLLAQMYNCANKQQIIQITSLTERLYFTLHFLDEQSAAHNALIQSINLLNEILYSDDEYHDLALSCITQLKKLALQHPPHLTKH
ncbi:hypothetical protein AN392_02047 [Pseudoalteromonas sp. P1-16-1b]|uniref:hypothetical protein n=1 Tax=Pseudoalteromonas sp. P1-16-1b TaxID=1723757 RepID=UPI0006D65FFE|nr:hypothetical protein [Pseudoalteromonas sp. P1-16-1b]KPZ64710.1 hypothetical protein AN392_02047 [Pseudoalteromonas sp. P1-16-1b]